jgi:hypothetical protein
MDKLNMKVEFEGDMCLIKNILKEYAIIARGYKEDGLY